jgi:hypothetical protein
MPSPSLALLVFLAWSGIQLALLAASLFARKPVPALLLAVEKVEPAAQEEEKSGMAKGFLWISVAWLAAVTAAAALAYRYAANGSAWGLAVFIAVGGWSLYEAASRPFVLGRMYPGSTGWQDWLGAALSVAVWMLLFAALAPRWLGAGAL